MTDKLAKTEAPADVEIFGQKTGVMSKPAWIKLDDMTGKEGITVKDIKLPRLCISQGLSKQMIKSEESYIPDLKLGEFFNDLTAQIYGEGPLVIIPLKRNVARIEFDPNDRNKVLDGNVPAGDPRLSWDGDKKPKATEFIEFVALLIKGEFPAVKPEPIVISIKQTNKWNRKTAQRLTSFIMMQDGPIYAGFKSIAVGEGKNDKGAFGVYSIKNAGFIQDQELFKYAERVAASFEGKNITANRNDDPDDFEPGAFDSGGGDPGAPQQ